MVQLVVNQLVAGIYQVRFKDLEFKEYSCRQDKYARRREKPPACMSAMGSECRRG